MNVADRNREMGRDGPGEDRCWLGVAEPGKHRSGALERYAEPEPVAVAVLLDGCFMQDGQRPGQVAVAGADGAGQ